MFLKLTLWGYGLQYPLRINLPLFSTVVVENKGKLILTEIFPSVQKQDIF